MTMATLPVLISAMFYTGLGLPLGVPPAEQDPLLLRVAPEQCLYYTTWAGMAEPDAQAGNPTEALLAEPEVRRFVQHVDKAMAAGIAKAAAESGDEDAQWFSEASLMWLKTLITRPTAIYLTKLEIRPGEPPDLQAALIVNTGAATAEVRDSLLKMQRMGNVELEVEEVAIEGVKFHRFRPAPDAPQITWGTRGRYLLLGVGEGSIEGLFANARTGPPQWLAQLREDAPVERISTMTYANLPALIDAGLAGMQESEAEQARKVVAALGLQQMKSYTSVTGLDKEGFLGRTVLELEDGSRGIFALADAEPLTADDLAPIPADSTAAFALQLDGQKVLDIVQQVAREADPATAKKIDDGLKMINQMIGLDLREEVLASLGDTWCVYNSAGEGGLLFTGLTATVDLRDPEKAGKVHKQLMSLAKAALQRPAVEEAPDHHRLVHLPPQLKQIEFQGRTIHYLTGMRDVPFAPAWCLTDTHLVVSLFPQNIEAMLARETEYASLASAPEIAPALGERGGAGGPLSVSYIDTKTLFEVLYPMGKIAATAALNHLAEEEGVDIDVSILPRAETIGRHLRPSVTSMARTERGIEFTTRQSLPGSSVGSSTPLAVALLLPAVQSARSAARRLQSLNNLKQIALALHNHHVTHARFPAAAIQTEDGNPGLSWRVKVLPFIEQQALYEQFHLDEPWDSEHNKKLIEKMPEIYRSPGSAAPVGYTTYLGVVGKDGIFASDDKEGTRIAEIRDGTSNTAMIVETNDRAAVPWTKPADFDPGDAMKPTEKLQGVWPKVFLTAFADGSVRAISTNIDPETLKALFTKNGGEVIDHDALHGDARRRRPRAVAPAAREAPARVDRAEPVEEAEELERVP